MSIDPSPQQQHKPAGRASSMREAARLNTFLPLGLFSSFCLAVLAVIAIAVFSVRALNERTAAADSITHTMQVIEQIQNTISTLKDAETGQRGYLLTGSEDYLLPYTNARASLESQLKGLRQLTQDNEREQRRMDMLDELSREKMDELARTIEFKRAGKAGEAMSVVLSDRGRALMDRMREIFAEMTTEERRLAAERRDNWERTATASLAVTGGGSVLLLVLIGASAVMTSRNHRQREAEVWLRAGRAGLSERLQGDRSLESLGDTALSWLATLLNAQAGAIYLAEAADGSARYRRIGSYALPQEMQGQVLRAGDGLLGQAAKDGELLRVTQVPAGYLTVSSSLGRSEAAELLILPVTLEGAVLGVLELAFFQPTQPLDRELLERVSESLAQALRAATSRSRLEALLEETRQQAEELQEQQEELQANNEELEEQSRVLQESQSRLESQHAELEESNAQLEEQSQHLERQRSELAQAQVLLTDRAAALERAGQYKSEFLANMSHELRTPLNSTLILAKLLSDNKAGNLTDEQVKFAQTISAAGNDLLALINDILDISKIEAGRIEVSPEAVPLARVVGAMQQAFEPIAHQRGLGFIVRLAEDAPAAIETDEARLGQILKNLISNALKFTEKGVVTLSVTGQADSGRVSFAVQDTGIGIRGDQQELIFEAFRQADGSTHRKYGGTGLGLSISRTLAHLLGGELTVRSRVGEGSVFTLALPAEYAGAVPTPEPVMAPRPEPAHEPAHERGLALPPADDDRENLQKGARSILVIEDDPHFAQVLRDLAREMGFPCVISHTASDGLQAARLFQPSAILLDMKLPDMSGFGVLDQLKRTPGLRHIPVHVISISDYAQEAMEMGAVGYALKPVKREELETALRRLEAKFSQALRRVLVVEDDERQREGVRQLLANDGVEIVGVASAEAALEALRAQTFDCMVMDLNLPGVNGYGLLDRMAREEALAFPPVIVYTGRSLSTEEEHALRRYSKSIIIKGARSPERLLDEVTLFLHQVESKLPPERQRMLAAVREREALLEGRRVLIVEDDVRNIFALSAALEPKGVNIEIARNGREALQALSTANPAIDLVLMDVMMPEMDGLTATREIRKRPNLQRVPIIALTAKAMRDDHEKCLAAGANDYIAKPLDVEKLLSLMRVWMQK